MQKSVRSMAGACWNMIFAITIGLAVISMMVVAYFPVTLAILWYLRHHVFPVSSCTDSMP